MSTQIIWQQDSSNPDNPSNLAKISQWWQDLNLKEIFWQQRLIPDRGNVDEINWESQQFDESFTMQMPQIRGITLYWYKSTFKDERSILPNKLILDVTKEQLYLYPQSQPKLVICISKPQVAYQKIEMKDPMMVGKMAGNDYILLLKDKQQQIELKVTLNATNLKQLLEKLDAGAQ